MMFYQGEACAERVFKVLDKKPDIYENENNPNLKIDTGEIEFENVSLVYPETEVAAIKNINISVKGGSTAALVGHSGAGKSTIINLIPRFYEPKEGSIRIDKQKIDQISLSSLRKNISLVSQDITLFDDTIKNNILYADLNATQKEIEKAAEYSLSLIHI